MISPVSTGHFATHGLSNIHRDLKPQNIFLARGPWGEAIPKVLDFGVSKLVDDREAVALTGTQAMLGTVTYMSPEQARGARGVDARSDQYAIGLILYEMVTGSRAHPGESALEILHHIANGILVAPRTARPELPAAMEAVLLRCLAAQPSDRYPSLRALGQALLPHAGDKARAALADGFLDLGPVADAADAAPIAARTPSLPPRVSPSAAGAREAEATALPGRRPTGPLPASIRTPAARRSFPGRPRGAISTPHSARWRPRSASGLIGRRWLGRRSASWSSR